MKKLISLVILAVILGFPNPVQAYQTEESAEVAWKSGSIRKLNWLTEVSIWKAEARERWEARERAAEADEAAASAVSVSSPTSGNPGCLSASAVASYARGAGFPESVIPTMVSIAYRESHYCPGAVNSSSGACGLWQLYPCPGSWALTPAGGASGAYAKYAASGLSPWGY